MCNSWYNPKKKKKKKIDLSLVTDCFELEPIISWGAKSYIAKTRLDKLWLGGSCLGAHEMQWWSGSRQSAVETGCTPHIWKDDEEKEEEEQFKRWWWWCRWWRFTCWSGLSVSQSQSFTTERLCFVMIFVQCARLPNDYQPRQLIKDRWQDVIAINHHLAYSQTGSAKTLWFINFHSLQTAQKNILKGLSPLMRDCRTLRNLTYCRILLLFH